MFASLCVCVFVCLSVCVCYVEVCVFAAGGGCGVWSKLFLTEALMP